MSPDNAIGVGLLGNGFMAKAHSKGLLDANLLRSRPVPVELVSISGRNEAALEEACSRYGWSGYTTDWKEQADDPRITLFHNTAPNALHVEPTIAAVRAGKHVLCEKPLATNADAAFDMWQAAEVAGVSHMCGFNFRFAPAARLAHNIIRAGELGEIVHFRAQFLESSGLDDRGLTWRDSATEAGTGAIADLGSHIVDLARWLVGEPSTVQARTLTLIAERAAGRVEVDDAFSAIFDFVSGATGVLEASRVAGGIGTRCAIEIDGTHGSLRFSSERLNDLEHAGRDRVVRTIRATAGGHPFMELWWPHPGHAIGWGDTFTHEINHLLDVLAEGSSLTPSAADFQDGYRCAEICDAILRASLSHTREQIAFRPLNHPPGSPASVAGVRR
jgi:predicted dehydrogenase